MDAAGSEVEVEDRSEVEDRFEVEVEERFEVEVEDRSSCLEVATPAFAFPVLANSGQIDPRLMTQDGKQYLMDPSHFSKGESPASSTTSSANFGQHLVFV